jgi:tetratricopeptide (TPR) repeat protein
MSGRDRSEPAPPSAPAPVAGGTPFDNALRLARMLGDQRTVAALLDQQALGPDAPWQSVVDAVEALEEVGETDRAAELLDRRARAIPRDRRALEALADLWARNGRSALAVGAWRRLVALAGPLPAPQALAFATVLDRTGQRDEALRVLADAKTRAPDDAVELWNALGTLAWQSDDDDDALFAYRKLWSSGDRRSAVAERLMTLAAEAGAYEEAAAVATEGYAKSGDADLLLDLASLQASKQDWAGVLGTLGHVDPARMPAARRGDGLMMRAEAYEHLREWEAARMTYRAALALDPSSIGAKTALLEIAAARDDLSALREYTRRWTAAAAGEPELWAPIAVALDRVGRSREALAFFSRVARDGHADPALLFDFADALGRSGEDLWAWRLRRRAVALSRDHVMAAVRDPSADEDARSAAESTAEVVRDESGPDAGERWLRAIERADGPRDARTDAFVASWCLREDRIECARRAVAGHLELRHLDAKGDDEAERWRGLALEIALAEDDHARVKDMLAEPTGLDAGDRIDALLMIERDQAAAAAITEALRVGRDDERVDEWRRRLAEIEERHAPSLSAAAAYDYVDGLGVYGPDAVASHDVGPARIVYTAGLRELSVQDSSLVQPGGVTQEVDGFVLARFGDPRGFEEAGAGMSFQTGTPLPRASVVGERLLRGGLGVTWHVGFDEPILDTGLLRLGAAQSIAEVGARYDFGELAYAEVDLHAREDHTRRFLHVANEAEEAIEAGVKLVGHEPEWDVGLQALASQRQNVATLPSDLAAFVPAADRTGDLSAYLPPSFQLVALVTHLTRGDFFERYRPDRASFPRYDCSAAAGVLLPDLDAALELQCAASVRVAALAYVSATASFERGFFGVADQTNAESRVSFTQGF